MKYNDAEQFEIEDLMNSSIAFDSYDSGFHEWIPGDTTHFEARDPVQRQLDLTIAHMWELEHVDNHARTDQVPTSSDWQEPLGRTFCRTPEEKYLATLARPLYDEDPNVLSDEEFELMISELNHGPRFIQDHDSPVQQGDGPRYAVLTFLLDE